MRYLLIAALGVCLSGQNPPAETEPPAESRGLPARASANEYQSNAQAGNITIAADFMEHSVPTPEAIYSSEDYIVVEAAVFGQPDAHATLSREHFSLRINDKKPIPADPYELVWHSLKDPNWSPPTDDKSKSKTGLSSGGKDTGEPPPSVIHMPMPLQIAMQKKVKNSVLLSGDRALPQAGLLFFEFRGKAKNIRTVELLYDGPAGKATITLQP
ncbi:MAG TPA: hypothetical protein VMJ34_16530 [Bryobacteraceae bacterium]|nr:hypothetical protein [Bryobacteraceae bacterium]